jgi:hypothetical protein
MERELYIVDGSNKNVRHRLEYDDIINVQTFDGGRSIIHTASTDRVILINNSVALLFDFYFKRHPHFIHASEHHIVNTSHIIYAEGNIYEAALRLTLFKGHIATLRMSHPYAYFIINGRQKKRKSEIEDCEKKDAIILSDIKSVRETVDAIYKNTGEKVTPRYVTKRYKQLKINS